MTNSIHRPRSDYSCRSSLWSWSTLFVPILTLIRQIMLAKICSRWRIKTAFQINFLHTVKPVLSSHSKIDKTKVLMANGRLMKVESIAECSPWSILQYFWPALSDNRSWKPILVFFLSGRLRQFFTVLTLDSCGFQIQCKHVFCFTCAKETEKTCPRYYFDIYHKDLEFRKDLFRFLTLGLWAFRTAVP